MATYGYIRTSRVQLDGQPGMDPATQERQLLAAGVPPDNVHRDVGVSGSTGTTERKGWGRLEGRLAQGDTLVFVALDRIGRNSMSVIQTVLRLQHTGVKLQSLTASEMEWVKYLNAEPDSTDAFVGGIIAQVLVWKAAQEINTIKRRTLAGLAHARASGKRLGRPPKVDEHQAAGIRLLQSQGYNQTAVARMYGVSRRTVGKWWTRQ